MHVLLVFVIVLCLPHWSFYYHLITILRLNLLFFVKELGKRISINGLLGHTRPLASVDALRRVDEKGGVVVLTGYAQGGVLLNISILLLLLLDWFIVLRKLLAVNHDVLKLVSSLTLLFGAYVEVKKRFHGVDDARSLLLYIVSLQIFLKFITGHLNHMLLLFLVYLLDVLLD